MKSAYPVFIAEHNNDFLVFVPDFEIYTEGKSMTDAMEKELIIRMMGKNYLRHQTIMKPWQ